MDKGMTDFIKVLKHHEVIPDVISTPPQSCLKVIFNCGAEVVQGNELKPKEVKDQPSVEWEADPKSFYTLIMTDPDAPSRKDPKFREYQHWLVTNIPGNEVTRGDVMTAYVGSGPPKGTGFHRYVFLLYRQTERKTFNEEKISKSSGKGRANFQAEKFAKKHKLCHPPIGVNFFKAQWDEYVPTVHKQLSGK